MNSSEKMTILLVEDQAIIAMSEAAILKKNGFDVIIANTGEQAIKIAEENSAINLILMDIDLGKGIDGTEAAQTILKLIDVPVVFLSNHTEKEVVEKTEKITSYGYVVKNSGETVLIASIKMAFKLFDAHQKVRESEIRLLESDRRFHTLEKQIDDIIWTMDMNFRFTYISPSVEKMHGFTVDEMMKMSLQDFLPPHSVDIAINTLGEHISNYLVNKAETTLVTFNLDQLRKDKTIIPTEIKARFLVDEEKNPIGIIGVTRDITERKQMEIELKENEARFRVMVDNLNQAYYEADEKAAFTYCNPELLLITGYTEQELLGTISFRLIAEEDQKNIITIYKQALQDKKTDISTEFRVKLKSGRKVWVEQITRFRFDESGSFDSAVNILRNIDDRKKAELSLLESRRALDLALEGAQVGFWDSNYLTGKVVRSEIWASMLGYTLDEVVNTTDFWWSHIHPDDIDRVREEVRKHEANQTSNFNIEHRIRTKSGSYKWILDWGKVFERDKNGNPVRAMGLHIDIDNRVSTERKLLEINKTLNLALEGSHIGLWDQNFVTGEVKRTEHWAKMLGYDLNEINENLDTWKSLLHPDDYDNVIKAAKDHESGLTEYFKVQHRLKCKDGSYKWVLNWGKISERDQNGKPIRAVGIHIDIDEQIKTEQALIESEQRLRYSLEATNDGIWEIKLPGKEFFASQSYYKILGYSSGEIQANFDFIKTLIHPDDLGSTEAKFWEAIKNKSSFSAEYRMKHKDGNYIWVLGRGRVTQFDSEGNVTRVSGSNSNINKRKLAEENLKKSQQMLLNILEQFPGVVFWKDKQSKYLGCNQAFAAAAGLQTSEQIAGKTDFDLPWASTEAAQYIQDDKQVIESAQPKLNIEETQHQSYDETKWFITNKVPLIDSLGNIIGILGTSNDITERKLAEEMLKNSEANLNAFINNRKEAIWSIDNEYNLILVNDFFKQEFLRVFGVELIKGTNVLNVLTSELKDFWKSKYDIALKGETIKFEYSDLPDDKSEQYEVSLTPIISEEKIIGVTAITQTITERKKAEEEIVQRKEELERFEKIVIGRELKMIELKERILDLEKKLKEYQTYE